MYQVTNIRTEECYCEFLEKENALNEAERLSDSFFRLNNKNALFAVVDSDLNMIVALYENGKQMF